MTVLSIVLDDVAAGDLLEEKGLLRGFVAPTHAVLQLRGTAGGAPCLMLVCEVEGKPVLVKMKLDHADAAVRAMRARIQYLESLPKGEN